MIFFNRLFSNWLIGFFQRSCKVCMWRICVCKIWVSTQITLIYTFLSVRDKSKKSLCLRHCVSKNSFNRLYALSSNQPDDNNLLKNVKLGTTQISFRFFNYAGLWKANLPPFLVIGSLTISSVLQVQESRAFFFSLKKVQKIINLFLELI